MKKSILTFSILLLAFTVWSQNQDTLKVKYSLKCSDRYSRDTTILTISDDTLIIFENKWKGLPSKPIAIRRYLNDTLVVALADTGKAFLTADCRVLTTIKIPGAFKTSGSISLKFQGKVFTVTQLTTFIAVCPFAPELMELKIYPNPARDIITFENGEACSSILIHNALGEKITGINYYWPSINLENYLPGVYYLSFITPNGVIKRAIQKL